MKIKKKYRAGAKSRARWDQNHLIFFTWPNFPFLIVKYMMGNTWKKVFLYLYVIESSLDAIIHETINLIFENSHDNLFNTIFGETRISTNQRTSQMNNNTQNL